MKYHKSARTLALVLAGLLTIPPVSAQAVTFADMNNVPWPGAEKSINKAAELGLVVGETINGKSYFKPKDPVSLSQACQLAYKLLIETGKAKADSSVQEKWATVLNTYKIQSWAHPAVSFCLEEGIVTISDLGGFVSGEVNKSATREQAAEILGRALTVGVPSKTASASSTIFKDNASISADAIPYIALLNAEKIVNGDDLGKFNPKSTLNRTETAVMVTNLYDVLKNTVTVVKPESLGTQNGTVKDMNSLYVNFENSNAYFLFASSGTTVTLNGDSSSVSEILELFKNGTTIQATLTLDSNNRITKMAATADAEKDEKAEKDTEGVITKITYDDDDGDGRLEINDTSSYFVRETNDVSIEITDEDGDEKDYDWDDLVELFDECESDGKLIEVKLTLYSDGDIKRITGEIVDDEDGQSDGDLKGDKVGEIKNLDYDDDDSGEIKIDNNKYYIDNIEDIDIEIDGDSADWDDLWELYEEYEEDGKDLRAAVDLDDDDKDFVTDIRVSTKESSSKNSSSGNVSAVTYDEDKEEGTIKIGSTTYKAPEVDDVEVDIEDGDSEITTWEELYNAYKDGKELDIEVEVDGKEVTEVKGKVTKAKGYLDSFGDDYLKLEGKKSGDTAKYYFTEYDREDDEEDWEEETDDISVSISRVSGVSSLYDFFTEWLDDEDIDLGTDDDEDCFELTFELDDDGFITKISGSYK